MPRVGLAYLRVGWLFDMPTGLKMGYHIFCDDKPDFYDITDGLPQFPQSG